MIFETPVEFSLHIESVASEKRMNHMEAILLYCADNYLEPDEIKHLVTRTLKDKIASNMREINLLPKTATLDIFEYE